MTDMIVTPPGIESRDLAGNRKRSGVWTYKCNIPGQKFTVKPDQKQILLESDVTGNVSALKMDGVTEFLTLSGWTAQLSAFTVGGWFYDDASQGGSDIGLIEYVKLSAGTPYWQLRRKNVGGTFKVNFYSSTYGESHDMVDWDQNQWNSVVHTHRSDGTVATYVNGVNLSDGFTAVAEPEVGQYISIAAEPVSLPPDVTHRLGGLCDQLFMLDSAVNDAWVTANWNKFAPDQTGMVGLWLLDEDESIADDPHVFMNQIAGSPMVLRGYGYSGNRFDEAQKPVLV